MQLASFLKNLNGEPEIGRISLAVGVLSTVTSPIGFQIWEMGWRGGHFDVAAWCLAYPGGIVALVAGGVFAIGNKEKQIAIAKATQGQGEGS